MRTKIFGIAFCLLVSVSVIFSSCTEKATTTSTSVATDAPTPAATSTAAKTGNWWDKFGTPEYGGEITMRVTGLSVSSPSFDPDSPFAGQYGYWLESLFGPSWTTDRAIWDHPVGMFTQEYYIGRLAESWERTDPLTYTVQLRKGIHWWNKAPVNGRELTAQDVQFSYDRVLGSGSGFTTPNMFAGMMMPNIERVVAVDNYTVQFKLKKPSYVVIYEVFNTTSIIAPEWVALNDSVTGSAPAGEPPAESPPAEGPPGGGPPGMPGAAVNNNPTNDWKNAVGTGPWMPTDFTRDVSLTISRNPEYWGYDERYPENRLPYVDTVKTLGIADNSTALAALRTGKLDMVPDNQNSFSIQEAAALAKSNPDIQIKYMPSPGADIELVIKNKPFDNIKVRQALEMAIDRKSIASGYYGGTIDGTPCGVSHPIAFKGWITPYEDWPEDLKEQYSYSPEKSKQLLAEAGYPNGFKTHCLADPGHDVGVLQICQSYFKDIGVTMDIEMLDPVAFRPYVTEGKQDQMALGSATGKPMSFNYSIGLRSSLANNGDNYALVNDPAYDELYKKFFDATTEEEAKKIFNEADLYVLRQHYAVTICTTANPIAWQPYIKGYSGEMATQGYYDARWWIDSAMKQSMGR